MMKSSPPWAEAPSLEYIQATGLASAATAPAARATGSPVGSPMGVTTGQREPWKGGGCPMGAMRDPLRAMQRPLWKRGASADHYLRGRTPTHLSWGNQLMGTSATALQATGRW